MSPKKTPVHRRALFARFTSLPSLVSLGVLVGFALLARQPLQASAIRSADTESLSNLPGFIATDSRSVQFSSKTCKPSNDGIDRRTPSCLVNQSFWTSLARDRDLLQTTYLQERARELLGNRRTAMMDFCRRQINRAEDDVSACDNVAQYLDRFTCGNGAQPTGVGRIICRWRENRIGLAYEAALSEFERAIRLADEINRRHPQGQGFARAAQANSPEVQIFYEAAFQALEIAEAIRSENPTQGTFGEGFLGYGYAVLFRDVKIGASTTEGGTRPEATNLSLTPAARQKAGIDARQAFASPEALASAGVDLSKLDPADSGFWRRPTWPIASYRTTHYNGQFSSELPPELSDSETPVAVTIERARGSWKVPRLTVTMADGSAVARSYKMRFKIRLIEEHQDTRGLIEPILNLIKTGSEVNSHPVVTNLAAALGFNIDPHFFKKNVRAYLPNDQFDTLKGAEYDQAFDAAQSDLLRALVQQAKELGTTWDFGQALGRVGRDESGRKYIAMSEVTLAPEAPESEIEVGSFAKETLGRMQRREFRAFEIFYAWIGDHDTRDGNSKLNVIRTQDPARPYRVVYSAADMGAMLGSSLSKEHPNQFNPDMVKEANAKEITLTYQTPFHGPLFDAVTTADARWITRLIAQLTPAQIRDAFLSAGYHPVIAEFQTQKLLRRRDQLVIALGLGQEFAPVSEMSDPITYRVKGAEGLFDELGRMVRCPEGMPAAQCRVAWNVAEVSESMKTSYGNMATELLSQEIGGEIVRVGITPTFFVDGVRGAAGVTSLLPARYMIPNPDLQSPYPYWLIDIIRVGFGTGIDDVFDSIPGLDLGKIKVMGYKVHEFIRVHPMRPDEVIGQMTDAITIYDPTKYPEKAKAALFGLRDSMIRDLQAGDMLISSNYLSFGAGVFQNLLGSPDLFLGVGLSASAGYENVKLSRTLISRDRADDAHAVVGVWETADQETFQAEAGLKFILLKLPLLQAQLQDVNQKDRVYRFDLSQPSHLASLQENLARTLPEISPELSVKRLLERDMKVKRQGFLASLFGFFNWWRSSEQSEITRPDGATVLSQRDFRENAGLLSNVMKSTSVEIESLGVVGDSPIAKLNITYRRNYANREHFAEIYQDWLPKLFRDPKQVVSFGAGDTNYYLGKLNLVGSLEFKREALNEIFAPARTRQEVCLAYAQSLPFTIEFVDHQKPEQFPELFCQFISSPWPGGSDRDRFDRLWPEDATKLRNILGDATDFLKSWTEAQEAWLKLRSTDVGQKKEANNRFKSALDKINSLLKVSSSAAGVAGVLTGFTSEENLIRHVTLTSSLNGFPGQERKIEFKSGQKSEFAQIKTQFDDLFVDRYFRHLEKFRVFYTFFSEKPIRSGAIPFVKGGN